MSAPLSGKTRQILSTCVLKEKDKERKGPGNEEVQLLGAKTKKNHEGTNN
jgi:hypothetical protein